jgi:hypothetical protein
MLGLLDILGISGFVSTARTRLVRHQHHRYPVDELRRNGWLELYQRYQGRPVFHKVDQIVSFYGLRGTRAAFLGVYRVLEHRPASEGKTLPNCPWSHEWNREARFFYDLERDARFSELQDRVVIQWGVATRAWVQKVVNKAVLEVQGLCPRPWCTK